MSQRLHCSQRCPSAVAQCARLPLSTATLLHHRVARKALQVSARVATAPKVVYMPNFLAPEDFAAVQREAKKLQPKLREELNCIANGRLGCYMPDSSETVSILSSKQVAANLTQRLRSQFPLFLSEFPVELRQYPAGSDMPWHLDEQMFARPQWEVIYTVSNSSDSVTQWRDDMGEEHSLWTEPNSMLAVEAEGWEHRVLPVKKGVRTILKIAYTSSRIKLPAYETNITRESYKS